MKRSLFIGPTGVGKSTLINIIYHQKVTKEYLSRPAITSDVTLGETSAFNTYYNLADKIALTDSIGFGDDRFEKKKTLEILKSVINTTQIGFNRVYLCLTFGRVSSDIRNYIDLIITVFGKEILPWCTIVITHCDEEMTKSCYLEMNRNDKYMTSILNQVHNIVFGDNYADKDEKIDAILTTRRQQFLNELNKDINSFNENRFFPHPQNDLEWIMSIYRKLRQFLNRVNEPLLDITDFSRNMVTSIFANQFKNYYGECIICMNDMWDAALCPCQHIFHKDCLLIWFGENKDSICPICRRNISFSEIHEIEM